MRYQDVYEIAEAETADKVNELLKNGFRLLTISYRSDELIAKDGSIKREVKIVYILGKVRYRRWSRWSRR